MKNTYTLLENVLNKVENDLKRDLSAETLSETFNLSSVHLQRLFRFSFDLTIADYVRSRRLTESTEDLLKSDLNIIDIALEYGFQYEQSYIRAFKREFGLTPGQFRKTGQIL